MNQSTISRPKKTFLAELPSSPTIRNILANFYSFRFKRVDVVVNNAGYGLAGCFEELNDAQMRTQMEVNFFGLIAVTKKAMEVMRDVNKPSGGLIQQVTSIGGQTGVPFFSIYCASKWAVEGFTETIAQEVKEEWGIRFTCVEPGGFRYVFSLSLSFSLLISLIYQNFTSVKHTPLNPQNPLTLPLPLQSSLLNQSTHPDFPPQSTNFPLTGPTGPAAPCNSPTSATQPTPTSTPKPP